MGDIADKRLPDRMWSPFGSLPCPLAPALRGEGEGEGISLDLL